MQHRGHITRVQLYLINLYVLQFCSATMRVLQNINSLTRHIPKAML